MGDERLLAIMATPVDVPAVVERSRWPVHVTVAGNFRIDATQFDEVAALLESAANGVAAFDVALGPADWFGAAGNIPVLLASHPTLHRLHESLAVGLKRMRGFAPAEPSFWEGGYRPHATLGPAVGVRDGDTLPLTTVTLVSLDGGLGHRVSAVELS